MAEPNAQRPPFDERAAEEELERIRASLEEWRRRRSQASESFDAFLRSFAASGREPRPVNLRGIERRSRHAPADVQRAQASPASAAASPEAPFTSASAASAPSSALRSNTVTPPAEARPAAQPGVTPPGPPISSPSRAAAQPADAHARVWRASEPPLQVPATSLSSQDEPSTRAATEWKEAAAPFDSLETESWIPEPTTPLTLSTDQRTLETFDGGPQKSPSSYADRIRFLGAALRARPRRLALRRSQTIAAIAVTAGVAALFLWLLRSPDEDVSPEPAAPAASAPAPSSPATPAAGPVAAASNDFLVLTTERHVWVRIVVDGARTVERELPAGQRIPINPQKTVVIRAGDAGAVRVTVNGQDRGPFGTDGFPATRTFTRPE